MEVTQINVVIADYDPVQGIILPVVFKLVRFFEIQFEIIRLPLSFYPNVYHTVKCSGYY